MKTLLIWLLIALSYGSPYNYESKLFQTVIERQGYYLDYWFDCSQNLSSPSYYNIVAYSPLNVEYLDKINFFNKIEGSEYNIINTWNLTGNNCYHLKLARINSSCFLYISNPTNYTTEFQYVYPKNYNSDLNYLELIFIIVCLNLIIAIIA